MSSYNFYIKEKVKNGEILNLQSSDIEESSLSEMKLLWHGEIEERLDMANPLLCTMIYDSCRYIITCID